MRRPISNRALCTWEPNPTRTVCAYRPSLARVQPTVEKQMLDPIIGEPTVAYSHFFVESFDTTRRKLTLTYTHLHGLHTEFTSLGPELYSTTEQGPVCFGMDDVLAIDPDRFPSTDRLAASIQSWEKNFEVSYVVLNGSTFVIANASDYRAAHGPTFRRAKGLFLVSQISPVSRFLSLAQQGIEVEFKHGFSYQQDGRIVDSYNGKTNNGLVLRDTIDLVTEIVTVLTIESGRNFTSFVFRGSYDSRNCIHTRVHRSDDSTLWVHSSMVTSISEQSSPLLDSLAAGKNKGFPTLH